MKQVRSIKVINVPNKNNQQNLEDLQALLASIGANDLGNSFHNKGAGIGDNNDLLGFGHDANFKRDQSSILQVGAGNKLLTPARLSSGLQKSMQSVTNRSK